LIRVLRLVRILPGVLLLLLLVLWLIRILLRILLLLLILLLLVWVLLLVRVLWLIGILLLLLFIKLVEEVLYEQPGYFYISGRLLVFRLDIQDASFCLEPCWKYELPRLYLALATSFMSLLSAATCLYKSIDLLRSSSL